MGRTYLKKNNMLCKQIIQKTFSLMKLCNFIGFIILRGKNLESIGNNTNSK